MKTKLTPCLWFDGQAEEAAKFYTSVFPDGKITQVTHYTEEGHDIHGRPAGSVMTVSFEVNGQPFTALNGGPDFRFSEAISFEIPCATQEEIDHYWEKLGEGGPPEAQVCGWVKDKYGLSWQVVPEIMGGLMDDSDKGRASRVMAAMLKMKKLDIATLKKAADGPHD